jgi:hypothetical protein
VSRLTAGGRAATLGKAWWSGRLRRPASIQRAVSSRCAYHHAASSASDCRIAIATKGEYDCQNTAGCRHAQRLGAFLTCLKLESQEYRIPVENRAFRFVRGHSISGEVSAIDLVPFEVNLSPLHSDNCIDSVVTLPASCGDGEFQAETKSVAIRTSDTTVVLAFSHIGKCLLLSVINIKPCARTTAAIVASASERVWPLRAHSYRSRPALRAIRRVTS